MKSHILKMSLLITIMTFAQTGWAADTSGYSWTGWYIGAHLGYGWGNEDTTITLVSGGEPMGPPVLELHPDPEGVTGGAQFGYNLQMECLVVGIEADFSGSAISGSTTVTPVIVNGFIFPHGTSTSHEDISWYGTLRPRLGYTITPNLLIYGTGGQIGRAHV